MSVIDDYLKDVGAPQKEQLERIRKIVRLAIPEAEEVISYGMPGYKYKNKYLIGFAPFKDHMSLFPTSHPLEVLEKKLTGYTLSRGTIQFTVDNPIPEQLIKELIRIRLDDISTPKN